MSKPKRDWWGYVKGMLRRYPTKTNGSETAAISRAIEKTKKLADGEKRISVIEMVYFKKTHTLQGAALMVNYSQAVILKWHQQFIWEVADNFRCEKLL